MSNVVERTGPSSLAWIESGDGPPVLFLHGLGGTSRAWLPQLTALSDRFRCIAWDLPGYGRSPLKAIGDRPMTFGSIAAALDALMSDLGITRADVVGLSFGGQQALHFALDYPERVGRLVLADTSAIFGADGTDPEEWMGHRLDPLDRGLTPAAMAEAVIDAITGDRFDGPNRQLVIDAFGRIGAPGLRAAVRCLVDHDVSDRLQRIAARVLVIVGEHDTETPPAYSRALVDGLRCAELAVITGVGHLTPSEDPATFNRLVSRFLSAD